MGSASNESKADDEPATTADCPLTPRQQTRNLIIYSTNIGLVYLAAPVLYVGIVHAALCQRLGASDKLSNLPSTAYLCATPIPVLVAWYFPYVRLLRRVLSTTYLIIAGMGALVVAALLLPTSEWVIPALVAHAAILGCALGTVGTFQWEMLGRGVAESRRGQALAVAFGAGPVLAALSSLAQQLILAGQVGPLTMPRLAYPWDFVILFAASVPIMGLASFLATRFLVPQPRLEVARQPFVAGVFGGLGQYLGNRLILLAVIASVLVYSGYDVMVNIALYTKEVTGQPTADYAGYQNSLRFGFKVVAGFTLGWLLTRTHPKAGMLATGSLCLAAVVWALMAPGEWFLLSFGIMGAGELFGIYYPNYILNCSPKSRMRRNMAFTSMMNLFAGLAPVLYGFISDRAGAAYGKKFGFQLSFLASIGLLVAALGIVLFTLPARPRPRESDLDASDRVAQPAKETASASP